MSYLLSRHLFPFSLLVNNSLSYSADALWWEELKKWKRKTQAWGLALTSKNKGTVPKTSFYVCSKQTGWETTYWCIEWLRGLQVPKMIPNMQGPQWKQFSHDPHAVRGHMSCHSGWESTLEHYRQNHVSQSALDCCHSSRAILAVNTSRMIWGCSSAYFVAS